MNIFHDTPKSKASASQRPLKSLGDDESDIFAKTTHAPAIPSTVERHPYEEPDLSVPGMWHVFRGKKVFRPYAPGVAPLLDYKPRVLFGPKRDDKSLELSSAPIPSPSSRSKRPMFGDVDDDPFMSRMKAPEIERPKTPEVESDSETDHEEDAPKVLRIERESTKRHLDHLRTRKHFFR